MSVANTAGVGSPSAAGNVSQYYLACSAGTGVTVQVNAGSSANMQMEIVNVTALANNAPDHGGLTTNASSGNSSTPNTGTTPTSVSAHAVAIAAFEVVNPGAAIAWGGTPTFITDAQDVSDVISGSTYTLSGAFYVASATGTFDAALTGITPT